MAQPVWVLSVDLQTKTATFQSGMADAAKSARGAFKDIQQGSGEMGRDVGYSMGEARHSVMILGEEFGVHLPRALTSFVSGLAPIGPALEAAFPFLAIILGATLFMEHLSKLHEEADKLAQSQRQFETASYNAFNSLHGKLLQAEIQADELNKDHLSALKHQLELIDQQSLDELAHTFDLLAKAADATFADIKSHWYTFGSGGEGAKRSLEDFKTQYDLLLAKGDETGASQLLKNKLEREKQMLADMRTSLEYESHAGHGGTEEKANAYVAARTRLAQAGAGYAKDEVAAQQTLLAVLNQLGEAEKANNTLKATLKDNAKHRENDRATGEASRAAIDQMKADNAAEEQAEREREEARQRAIARLENGERQKIAATKQGSQERLQAIDAAIRQEEKFGLQETAFYQSLLVQRIETTRQMVEEEARIRAEAGREAAAHAQKMGELEIAAEREAAKLRNSSRRVTQQELIDQEVHFADEEYAIQLAAINKQITALDKNDKDYENKLRALYNKQEELEREHQNKITEIKDRAEIQRNAVILAAEDKLRAGIAQNLTAIIMHHKTFAAMITSVADQAVSGLLQAAIKYELTLDASKRKEAAAAARKAFLTGWHFPFPVNLVMAPALGAMAFESMMGFNQGGIVPGVGKIDTVPAVLTPGEHVSDQELTNGLRNMVRNGGASGSRAPVHIHIRPTYNLSALDGDGINDVLERHNETLSRHVEQAVRKLNH